MRTIDVSINGISMKSLGRIYVNSVAEEPVAQNQAYLEFGNNRIQLSSRDKSRRITIRFCIAGIRDINNRSIVMDAVNAWLQPGYLTVTTRPGQRIRVWPATYAALGDMRDPTIEYSATLECAPYWEDVATTAIGNLESFSVPWAVSPEVDVDVTPSENTDAITVTTPYSEITVRGTFEAGTTYKLTHADGVLVVPGTLVGDDDIVLKHGVGRITVNGGLVAARMRGRYR